MNEDTPPTSSRPTLELAPDTPAAYMRDLQTEHRELDAKIAELYDFPYTDQLLLQRLKKRKLGIKDKIERLKDEMIPDLNA